MTKENIKQIILGLGLGVAVATGVAVNMPMDEKSVESVLVIEECKGEELQMENGTICFEKGAYKALKALYKTKGYNDNPLYLWTDAGRLHLAIINHELEKQNKVLLPKDVTNVDELWTLSQAIL